jgi:hypothetical protein
VSRLAPKGLPILGTFSEVATRLIVTDPLRILLKGQVLLRQRSNLQLPALEQRQSGIKKKSPTRVPRGPRTRQDGGTDEPDARRGRIAGVQAAFSRRGYTDDEEEARCD